MTHAFSFRAAALFIAGAALFLAAYCPAPLYYSNQNQYFLHGLARAGLGYLHEDWLANTADPTPLFSGLVAFTGRFLHPWAFYVYQALLLGAYGAALLALFVRLAGPETAARRWPVFLALLLAVHAGIGRWLSYRLFGQDYPWFLQAGVAGQYVLGGMLQPSFFGVLLVVSVSLFMAGRPYLAVACAALGATIHTTYLLPAGLLTAGYLTAFRRERSLRQTLALGAVALILVLPVIAYVLVTFRPTLAPKMFGQAQAILVHVRIPHHCLPRLWFDTVAGFQIAWVVLGAALAWRTRLFPVLAVAFTLAALLTVVEVLTDSDSLALLFPWRVSAILVPLATAVILTRLVALRPLPLDGVPAQAAAGALALALVVAGVWITAAGQAYRSNDDELPVLEFVRGSCKAGDVYLVPVRVPDLAGTTRGSLSSDFRPLAARRADVRVIPLDMQRFRLATGAPIFVDFKSIPYRDVYVIEWYDRLRQAEGLQAQLRQGQTTAALPVLGRLGITHVVLPADGNLPELERVYRDDYYQVYRVAD